MTRGAKGPLVSSTRRLRLMHEPDGNGCGCPKDRVVSGHVLCMFGFEYDARIQRG